jgi:hypothetical protein
MAASATQVRDADRMADMATRDSMGAAPDMDAANSATNVATAEMGTAHCAAKVTTATTKMTTAAVPTATAAVSASTATASEGLRLYRAHSQSDNRNDDSNLAQHYTLHPGRSRVRISGSCRHSAPEWLRSGRITRSLSEPIGVRLRRLAAADPLLRQSDWGMR